MDIIIRADDSVELSGYVNAVERKSRPIHERAGIIIERIKKGAFARALERGNNIDLLENHRKDRVLGSTADGSVELTEDPIGLKIRAVTRDPEARRKALAGDYVGWSFGYLPAGPESILRSEEAEGPVDDVYDMTLDEVSIIDRSMRPCYEGTLVAVRGETKVFTSAMFDDEINVRAEPAAEEKHEEEKKIDYSVYLNKISHMKGEKQTNG